jgi:hypothetical protein
LTDLSLENIAGSMKFTVPSVYPNLGNAPVPTPCLPDLQNQVKFNQMVKSSLFQTADVFINGGSLRSKLIFIDLMASSEV